ncbi:peptide-methionine (R)-S-oxide reductase MsrB [Salinimicrobium sp. CAU 1759]
MKRLFLLIFSFFLLSCNSSAQDSKKAKTYPVSKSEAEWKAELNPAEFQVLRKKGTERAFSSKLNRVNQPGTFVCAACGNELYRTKDKFESGTGWPSFDRPISEERVDYKPDGYAALEVLCANCGGHLGHRFNDGPRNTTGKRHCINGVALNFIPANAE